MKIRKVYSRVRGNNPDGHKYYVTVYQECSQEACTFCHRVWVSEKAKELYMNKHLKSGKHWKKVDEYFVYDVDGR